MDLAKAWLIALAIYLAGSITTAMVAVASGMDVDDFTGTGAEVVWSAIPALLIYLLMTLLVAITHGEPHRDVPARHVLAVLLPPALLIVAGIAYSLVQGSSVAGIAAGALAGLAGSAAGWWLSGRLRSRSTTARTSGGYF
ncbi:hypothetical protein [Spirillospora sp. CA-294931]|uniref:hypothetical protein n=1 Tax=Spirillospora sp. CA-294931 TaxID=3240042 RepID=UPI003D9500AB